VNPNEVADAYFYIASSFQELEDLDSAVVWLKKADKLTPYMRKYKLELASIYIKQFRIKEALENISKALQIKQRYLLWADDGDSWLEKPYSLAFDCFLLTGQKNAAEACLLDVEKINPSFPLINSMKKALTGFDKE
jgi:tetratricopeptide (TPR) repeat protein